MLSLDADFLRREGAGGPALRAQFASRRRVDAEPDRLNRLYVVEATPSVTGGRADHRLPLKASQIDGFARADRAPSVGVRRRHRRGRRRAREAYVDAIAEGPGARTAARSLVVAGEAQPPAGARARARDQRSRSATPAQTITYLPTPEIVPSDQHAALRELVVGHERRAACRCC